jgi:hypothetical protein
MNKNLVLVMLLLVAAVSAQAQVTIGDLKNPEPFSILELVSGSESNNGNRGLRLPQLTTEEREAMVFTGYETEALGLQIFNRSTRCVETWNGSNWIQSCFNNTPAIPPVSPFGAASCGINSSEGDKLLPVLKTLMPWHTSGLLTMFLKKKRLLTVLLLHLFKREQ